MVKVEVKSLRVRKVRNWAVVGSGAAAVSTARKSSRPVVPTGRARLLGVVWSAARSTWLPIPASTMVSTGWVVGGGTGVGTVSGMCTPRPILSASEMPWLARMVAA
jgi:hypothetical protein